jgi:hypothetical protein
MTELGLTLAATLSGWVLLRVRPKRRFGRVDWLKEHQR